VQNGLQLVTAEKVLIHDAARCFTPASVFAAVSEALAEVDCVIPAVAVTDTIKVVESDQVQTTLDRNQLRAAQTPQGFTTELLKSALEMTQEQFTDEAALMQSHGHAIKVVQGDQLASKITTSNDLALAAGDHGRSSGIGTDAHKFSQAGTLVLGCLEWSELPKLEGHSDGDAIAHAIVDAVLSGAALGDIGSNFGVDRPEYAGASGEVFLTEAIRLANARGFEIENIAVQVVADKPKIGPRRNELESKLSSIVGAPVSVGATTTDGLGFLSDSRGVAAVATALLRRRS
jgi:2-C-methyl-D-erythritol 4-phosphate cytidylyltransferase/2-C-methyl-D-erythritol 2,4-cyclodiphosphate synthase